VATRREHARWALPDFGFKATIAESFADIFFNNCFKNGILPIVLAAAEVEALFSQVAAMLGYRLVVDLPAQVVIRPDGYGIPFAIDTFRKECLVDGWNDIGLTLRHADKISEFEARRRIERPWLFS
jgi:3-isopropylmalate/(R)-2-methylmalate dehydratase small subunit